MIEFIPHSFFTKSIFSAEALQYNPDISMVAKKLLSREIHLLLL